MPKITVYKEEEGGEVRYFLNNLAVAVLSPDKKAAKSGVKNAWSGWSFGSGGSTDSLLSLGKFGQLYSMFFRGENSDYTKDSVVEGLEIHIKALRKLFKAEDPPRKVRKLTENGAVYMLNGVAIAQVHDWRKHPIEADRCVICTRPAFLETDEPEIGFTISRRFDTMEEAYAMGKATMVALVHHLFLGEDLPDAI